MDNENFNVEFGEVVNIGGGTSDFNQLSNRPKYNNTPMTGATNIPKVPTKTSELNNDSDYQTGTEVESAISTAIAGKQDTLTAGNNITISNNTISATDTTYSAGTGLTLDGTQFSVNTETIATQQDVSNEATARENADTNLQGQIDAISASSDVTDIVGTYADLQAYDTTHLKDNDIIKVLQDESQNGETTYYRWSTSTQTFTLIGEEGPYYTKSQTDTLLQAKQDTLTAGSNITIASDNTISATDTTYSAFTGTDGQTAGTAGLVPAPATTDAGKFLKADGTWDTAGGDAVKTLTSSDFNWNLTLNSATEPYDCVALWLLEPGIYQKTVSSGLPVAVHANPGGIETLGMGTYIVATETTNPDTKQILYTTTNSSLNWYQQLVTVSNGTSSGTRQFIMNNNVVQTTGTSTADVMSQNAVTSMVFADPSTKEKVNIGGSGAAVYSIAIGTRAFSGENNTGESSVAIGNAANTYGGNNGVAIGNAARARSENAISIGFNAGHPTTDTQYNGAISLGAYSEAHARGEMNIGSSNTSYGYNNTNYRLLSGVYDGQSAHDAATVAQGNTLSTSAPTTSTVGVLGQLYTDTTNMHTYQCTAISGDTYTWTQRW